MVHASPAFWDFFFEESCHLQACHEGLDTRTLVRLDFKLKESRIPFQTKDPAAGKEIGYGAKYSRAIRKRLKR